MELKNPASSSRPAAGMTLVELTIAIMVLLAVTTVLFVGMRSYKAGSDRAMCVMNIYSVQNAVRSYANMNGLNPGSRFAGVDKANWGRGKGKRKGGGQSLKAELVGPDRFLEEFPECPGAGEYRDLGNRIPEVGQLYISCSLSKDKGHEPKNPRTW